MVVRFIVDSCWGFAAVGNAKAEGALAKAVEMAKANVLLSDEPVELDRVLGYEASFAETSFATVYKWKSKSFNFLPLFYN